MKKRLDTKIFRLDPRIKDGYYSDVYFNRTREILLKDNHHPVVTMQVFQRNNDTCVCGVDEAVAVLKEGMGNDFRKIRVFALSDGDIVNAWETVMMIEGDYSLFAHLETVCLGALARGTRIATNVYRCVREANGKPILFFPARFDSHLVQAKDGYSYNIGRKAGGNESGGISTDAQGEWWGAKGLGTIPHGLIAAYGGDTVRAALKFAEHMPSEIKRVVLVDYDNSCIETTLKVATAMQDKYEKTKDERYRLFAVRLDTSGNMIDEFIQFAMRTEEYTGMSNPTGVNPFLVDSLYHALKQEDRSDIKIIVSGGFDYNKIRLFEHCERKGFFKIYAYGVGSSLFNGNFDYTADIVQMHKDGKWVHNAKKGRCHNPNSRLAQAD